MVMVILSILVCETEQNFITCRFMMRNEKKIGDEGGSSILPSEWNYQIAEATRKQFGILKKLMERGC